MLTKQPVIILVKPQLASNVGMVARAMLNFGLTDLRLVSPRDNNAISNASSAASGANLILDQALIFTSLEEAVADLNLVYATTARTRYLNKPIVNLHDFSNYSIQIPNAEASNIGIMFGPENFGLSNEHLKYANVLLNIPTNKEFSSLNLAAAVLLISYEWNKVNFTNQEPFIRENQQNNQLNNKKILAEFAELNHFFNYMENALESKNFFTDISRKNNMVQNLRNIFLRNNLTKAELNTLYGTVKMLAELKD
ncbi:RNA methyltransferase [Rickettsiales bacterium LUAb2]